MLAMNSLCEPSLAERAPLRLDIRKSELRGALSFTGGFLRGSSCKPRSFLKSKAFLISPVLLSKTYQKTALLLQLAHDSPAVFIVQHDRDLLCARVIEPARKLIAPALYILHVQKGVAAHPRTAIVGVSRSLLEHDKWRCVYVKQTEKVRGKNSFGNVGTPSHPNIFLPNRERIQDADRPAPPPPAPPPRAPALADKELAEFCEAKSKQPEPRPRGLVVSCRPSATRAYRRPAGSGATRGLAGRVFACREENGTRPRSE